MCVMCVMCSMCMECVEWGGDGVCGLAARAPGGKNFFSWMRGDKGLEVGWVKVFLEMKHIKTMW